MESPEPRPDKAPLSLHREGMLPLKAGHAEREARFVALYQESRVSLRAFLRCMIPDNSAIDDCLQETALVVWKKMRPEWNEEEFRRFAFTCARFKALSWLKKNKPDTMMFSEPQVIEQLADRIQQAARSDGESGERVSLLRGCIDSLAPSQRELVWARYRETDPAKLQQLSGEQGKSMAAIYKQLERLRGILRDCVERKLRSENP